jgi:hypothetical protein
MSAMPLPSRYSAQALDNALVAAFEAAVLDRWEKMHSCRRTGRSELAAFNEDQLRTLLAVRKRARRRLRGGRP